MPLWNDRSLCLYGDPCHFWASQFIETNDRRYEECPNYSREVWTVHHCFPNISYM
uniref:Uncharacterized protein n=1 Tax=Oryza brachyantha TaxID=4533 RepID=J3KZI8_ORYBR